MPIITQSVIYKCNLCGIKSDPNLAEPTKGWVTFEQSRLKAVIKEEDSQLRQACLCPPCVKEVKTAIAMA